MNDRQIARSRIVNQRIRHLHQMGMKPSKIAKEAQCNYEHVKSVIAKGLV
jgi:hypothetical protein